MSRYLWIALAFVLASCGGSQSSRESSSPRLSESFDVAAAASACGNTIDEPAKVLRCSAMDPDGLEPPCNPQLAQDAWSGSHRANYAQASSPLPGVTTPTRVNIDHAALTGDPVVLSFSERDTQGRQAVWGSVVGFQGQIVKLDSDTVRIVDRLTLPGFATPSVSGAYSLLDRDQNLIVGQADALQVFGDEEKGNRHSGIRQLQKFVLPAEAKCGTRDDTLAGISMLPDGHVAFVTKFGMVGVLPRQPEAMCAETLRTYSINGSACDDASIPDDQLEEISNSIASDDTGGIYVVTSKAQHRINWDGRQLRQAWRANYSSTGKAGSGRLGAGSGSTPSLMGLPSDRDRFVVITDGQLLTHLVLMWRDDIPSDWQPIKPGLDRRIACEFPVTFGDDNAQESLSEQSVLVRGHAAVVVNNQMKLNAILSAIPSQLQPLTQVVSGLSINRPNGLQRIDWNPKTRRCQSVWSNKEVSMPNAIPSMSASSNQIFGIGSRTVNGIDTWTLESMDFTTGTSKFSIPSTPYPTDNSAYAATTIGPNNSIWTGTFGGVTRYSDCSESSNCGRRVTNPLLHIPLDFLP